MTDWAPIILTALGSGALGSIITTYGTQTRERRQARAQAREAIRRVQGLTLSMPTHDQLSEALDNLEISAMLARLPKKLTSLNREALYNQRNLRASAAELGQRDASEIGVYDHNMAFTSEHIARETTQLLIDATWHPILVVPYRWWRTRQMSRVMDTSPRPGPRPRDKRRWERETIRKAKRDTRELKHRNRM